ncbi:MAG: galactokinase [Thermoguttaceae bacterium]
MNAALHPDAEDLRVRDALAGLAAEHGLDVAGGRIRRTSSRFCLGVEHGDYNGTELFGVGTDRFIWMAYKPNATCQVRLFSHNFPGDGVVCFPLGEAPPPDRDQQDHRWARFPLGVSYVLGKAGYPRSRGFDAVLLGNIPGGGMSRSASLSLNLILSFFDVQEVAENDGMKIVDLAQAVENEYIGSPCGKLDQIMIYFAKEGMGAHYHPKDRSIAHIPFGANAEDFRIVSLDTGTMRPGLEKSTYKLRRAECEKLAALAAAEFGISCLADVRDPQTYRRILDRFGAAEGALCRRLTYIYGAQNRFYRMLDAWKTGDIATVGALFREDGIGLRDDYQISGPELETMCDIVRTVPGVYGERMLGGGDKGASGALVAAGSVDAVREAVKNAYPRSRPEHADDHAVHVCKVVDGVTLFDGLL